MFVSAYPKNLIENFPCLSVCYISNPYRTSLLFVSVTSYVKPILQGKLKFCKNTKLVSFCNIHLQ